MSLQTPHQSQKARICDPKRGAETCASGSEGLVPGDCPRDALSSQDLLELSRGGAGRAGLGRGCRDQPHGAEGCLGGTSPRGTDTQALKRPPQQTLNFTRVTVFKMAETSKHSSTSSVAARGAW